MGTETTVHDVSDRVTSFTSFAGRSTQSTYDGAGRVREQDVEQTSGASVHQQRVRDSAGRLVQLDTGHGSIHYTYTVDDRIATRAYPGGRVETFTYDAKGRIASRQLSGENAFLYEYDAQDRVITIRRAPSVHDLAWVEDRYAYDDTGRLATWWHDRDQIRTVYQYDLGHVSRVDRYVDAPVAGQNTPQEDEQVLACLRDITRQVPYNAGSTADPRLVECPQEVQESLQQRFGTPIPHVGSVDQLQGADLQVARYAVSQPLSIEVNNIYYRPGADYFDREVYIVTGHNDTMRQPMLVDGAYTNVGESLEYDDLGQRTTVQPMTGVDPSRNYTYTAGGQVATATEDGVTQTYTYDNRERLTRVDYSDGRASVLVDYDQQDRIVSLDRYGTTDGDLDLTWDGQGIAAIREHGDTDRTLYPIYNLRGDATAYLDDSGQTIANLAYTPWGQREATGDPIWSSLAILGYQARYASLTLSPHQVWMRGRTYDPELKTFNQTDPANAQQGTGDTAYSYAGNDPVNGVDPSGMATWMHRRRAVEWSHVDPVGLKVVKSGIEIKWMSDGTRVKNGRCRFSWTLTQWDPWYYTPVSVWQNVSLPDTPNRQECKVEHRNLSWVQGYSLHTWYNDVFHHYYNTPISDGLNNISGFCANEEDPTWAIFEVALSGEPKDSSADTLNDRVTGGCASRLHTEKHGVSRLPTTGTRNADYPLSGTLGIKWVNKRSLQMKAKPAFP